MEKPPERVVFLWKYGFREEISVSPLGVPSFGYVRKRFGRFNRFRG